jgi:hypothetical protein
MCENELIEAMESEHLHYKAAQYVGGLKQRCRDAGGLVAPTTFLLLLIGVVVTVALPVGAVAHKSLLDCADQAFKLDIGDVL